MDMFHTLSVRVRQIHYSFHNRGESVDGDGRGGYRSNAILSLP